MKQKFVVQNPSNKRVDQWLVDQPTLELSRSRVNWLVKNGHVLRNGGSVKSSDSVREGDVIEVETPEATPSRLVPLNQPLDIIFEDPQILVINKPAGLVVHPAAGHAADTLVNALVNYTPELAVGFGESRPGIVHRIDKETSGLLVVARTNLAHERLAAGFKAKTIHRIYEAACVGVPKNSSGTIESTIARHPTDRKRFASLKGMVKGWDPRVGKHMSGDQKPNESTDNHSAAGRWARTHYRVLGVANGLALLELKLDTGRTHQIRVHLSELGLPIIGDRTYGFRSRHEVLADWPRVALHAKELGFIHPTTGKDMMFSVPWPADLADRLAELGLIQR